MSDKIDFMGSREKIDRQERVVYLIHYVAEKPWQCLSANPEGPLW